MKKIKKIIINIKNKYIKYIPQVQTSAKNNSMFTVCTKI